MMTVLSVSKLNFYLRALLEGDAPLQNLYVSGEISNFKRYPTSGHCYFTLRDEKAQLKCVLFAAQGAHLRFAPENGMRVICRGRVSVYETACISCMWTICSPRAPVHWLWPLSS